MTSERLSRRLLKLVVSVIALGTLAIAVWQFPWATDEPLRREDALKDFYEIVYSPSSPTVMTDTPYANKAMEATKSVDIMGLVKTFVATNHLQNARVLDVGSGSGYLQDVVNDYTGLDISSEAARFYHKPFVAGTATAMPFRDGEFDAAWSIWVYEHIPNPEAALDEIRRVVKPGGLILMKPAWDCKPWAADGYETRPYSDFGPGGKLVKASITFRKSVGFWHAAKVPSRIVRSAAPLFGPTRLHYRRLTPNYKEYWQTDSDAVNSLDSFEMAMWFESRGDKCLTCQAGLMRYIQPDSALVIQVNPGAIIDRARAANNGGA